MSPDLAPVVRVAGRGLVAVGALAVGAAVGALAERALLRGGGRPPTTETGEVFGSLRGALREVVADDGTILYAEIDEAPGSGPPTIVFCHGYALNLDSFHYQRQALRGKARLVFFDQRSHGRSARADFE